MKHNEARDRGLKWLAGGLIMLSVALTTDALPGNLSGSPLGAPPRLVGVGGTGLTLPVPLAPQAAPAHPDFVNFESGQVRPLALSPDGSRLYALNTPDNRLEIFAVSAQGLAPLASVPVGLEPVAVAVRNAGEVWVVNHLSDSVSVVDVAAATPHVRRTLWVGDEPRDIVFSGPDRARAFVTAAHRGQNSPWTDPDNPGQFETPGVGRADVWVFDAADPGTAPGGKPLTVLNLFTDTPRALAVSPDGGTVYAAGFATGNRTTTIPEEAVCDGGASAAACVPAPGEKTAPGGLPAPNASADGVAQKEVGLIVQYDGTHWVDELGRHWDDMVRFSLPDLDVFAIDANAATPRETRAWAHVGTTLYNLAVNPVSGRVYVSNTESRNAVRFEGERPDGSDVSTVRGRLAEARISVLDAAGVRSRHLNKHIDYRQVPSPAGTAEKSLATPTAMAVSRDGRTLYVAAFGSSKVGVFDTTALETDRFVPDTANQIALSGGGPAGLALDEARGRLYVLTRFDNAVAVVDTRSRRQIAASKMFSPEPAAVVAGRRFLYDARYTSSNGEASCASCHTFGDQDSLAWDLGNPLDTVVQNRNPFRLSFAAVNDTGVDQVGGLLRFHPMKGPMATQSLRGMAHHGPLHWRGDRTGSADAQNVEPDQGGFDEAAGFDKFNGAFVALLGREAELTPEEMRAFTDFAMTIVYPPNPVRALDNSLTARQQKGSDFYFNLPSDTSSNTCNSCHVIDRANGQFGSDGRTVTEGETQEFKVPQLRNMYQKVGMFGRVQTDRNFRGDDTRFTGDQIRGFGFLHDGSADTLVNFFRARVFPFVLDDATRADLAQFAFAFDSDLFPVVGQQVDIGPGTTAAARERLDLLAARAGQNECELVAKGVRRGAARGWWRDPADGRFVPDRAKEAKLALGALLAGRAAAETLTFTCVPPGSGRRIGIDRDRDAVLDGDEI